MSQFQYGPKSLKMQRRQRKVVNQKRRDLNLGVAFYSLTQTNFQKFLMMQFINIFLQQFMAWFSLYPSTDLNLILKDLLLLALGNNYLINKVIIFLKLKQQQSAIYALEYNGESNRHHNFKNRYQIKSSQNKQTKRLEKIKKRNIRPRNIFFLNRNPKKQLCIFSKSNVHDVTQAKDYFNIGTGVMIWHQTLVLLIKLLTTFQFRIASKNLKQINMRMKATLLIKKITKVQIIFLGNKKWSMHLK